MNPQPVIIRLWNAELIPPDADRDHRAAEERRKLHVGLGAEPGELFVRPSAAGPALGRRRDQVPALVELLRHLPFSAPR
jgi:hypothetical protein